MSRRQGRTGSLWTLYAMATVAALFAIALANASGAEAATTQQAYAKADNPAAGDGFGWVAVSGDTMVVGAPGEDSNATGVDGDDSNDSAADSGAAYVYTRSGTDWIQQAYLKAFNTGAGDGFGSSVAISGNTVVVGAPGEDTIGSGVNPPSNDTNGNSNRGAAYVFTRSGTDWSQQAFLKASPSNGGDVFGTSVAISSDTLVVGARLEDTSAADSGAAYVFTRSGTDWSQQARLKASNAGAGDEFGGAVSISGDTVVVGAQLEDSSTVGVNSTPDELAATSGAAYVFTRSGINWTQQAYLKASNTGSLDQFGVDVAVSGDTVVVGGVLEDSSSTGVDSTPNEGANASGAAYVFTRSGTSWTQQAYLKMSPNRAEAWFGLAVEIDGDSIVVGAPFEDSSTTGVNSTPNDLAGDSGAAYVFTRTGSAWSQQAYLKASNTGAGDGFGIAVGISGDTIAVGAVNEDSNAAGVDGNQSNDDASNSGAVYVFALKTVPTLTTTATPDGTVGESISDTATLAGGDSPSGTISFRAYGPGDANCSGTPAYTDTVNVSGNGSYPSGNFTPTQAGAYRWTADYTGDERNEAASSACNAPNETSTVGQPPRRLSLAVDGARMGHVTGSPGGIDCGAETAEHSDCSERYADGTQVALEPKPAEGYGFAGFSGGGCTERAQNCTVQMDADKQVAASFVNVAPEIDRLRLAPARFVAGGAETGVQSRGKTKGTKVRFTLSEAATVHFRVRREPPVRVGAPPPKFSHKFHRELEAGPQAVRFTGTLDGRKFPPGKYRIAAWADDSAGLGSERIVVPFRIKRK